MTVPTFYRLTLALPLAAPMILLAVGRALGRLTAAGSAGLLIEILLYSLIYGGVPYLLLASWASWHIGGRSEAEIRRTMFLAPLLMAALLAAVAIVTGLVTGAVVPFAAVALLGAIVSIALGYLYVAAVAGLRETVTLEVSLRDDFFDHFPVHVGEPHVSAVEPIRQILVFQPQQIQNRRVQLVDALRILERRVAVLIG